jgi:hypothetical protein
MINFLAIPCKLMRIIFRGDVESPNREDKIHKKMVYDIVENFYLTDSKLLRYQIN